MPRGDGVILEEQDLFLLDLGVVQPHLVHEALIGQALGAVGSHDAEVQVTAFTLIDERLAIGVIYLARCVPVDVKLDGVGHGVDGYRDVVPLAPHHGYGGGGNQRARRIQRAVGLVIKTDGVGQVSAAAPAVGARAGVAHQHHAPAQVSEHGDHLRANLSVRADPRFERHLRCGIGEHARSVDLHVGVIAVEVKRTGADLRRSRRRVWRRRHERRH
mmetsp:Transcript_36808/g.90878  ORF Transcript_36808/g.90878 Transcript_36808/m.90878 type:complete len:216 (+) Transcript_36808:4208-4855(+)